VRLFVAGSTGHAITADLLQSARQWSRGYGWQSQFHIFQQQQF